MRIGRDGKICPDLAHPWLLVFDSRGMMPANLRWHLRWVGILAVLATPLALAASAVGQEAPATWYGERIISGDVPVHVEHLWSKGPKLRAEMVIRGHPILTLVNAERYITIDRLTNTGVSIQRSPRAIRGDATRGRPFGQEGSILQAAGGEKVSTQEIAGRRCDLYRLTNGEGRQEVCITQDQARLPLLVRIWRRSSGKEAITRYFDWASGLALSDEFFEPGSAVTLEHVTYDEYVRRAADEKVGPAPPFFRELLHGTR
jgi:hypothetical protein